MLRRLVPCVILVALIASAQNPPIAAKLLQIHVQGSVRYSEPEIVSTLPLHIGQITTPNDFKAASDKLVESGAFQTVAYEYGPAGTGYSVTFKVQDEPRWIKVSYANLLWFTPEELDAAIRERVPLFRGEVPMDGGMIDAATDALQQLVAKRGIPGTVHFLHTAKLSGQITGGKFLIEGVAIKITHVDVTGGGAEQKQLDTAAARLLDIDFEQDEADQVAQLTLIPAAKKDGYIRIQVGEVEAKLTNADVHHPAVSVVVPVTLGDQYRLSDIIVSGNQVIPTDEINREITVKTGMPANDVQIREDLAGIRKIYGTRGYLMAQVSAEPEVNDATHTVSYRCNPHRKLST